MTLVWVDYRGRRRVWRAAPTPLERVSVIFAYAGIMSGVWCIVNAPRTPWSLVPYLFGWWSA